MGIPRHTTNICLILLMALLPLAAQAAESLPPPKPRSGLREVVRVTLAGQPAITLAKEQVRQSRGGIDLALADFDWRLDTGLTHSRDYRPTGGSLLYDSINSTAFDLRLSRKTRYGFSLGPEIMFRTDNTNVLPGSGLDSTVGNTLRVAFNLNVPLLQGYGRNVTTAREKAARNDLEANRYELLHTTSLAVFDTINGYWDYIASQERLKQAVMAEQRAASFVTNTETLVNADEIAPSELISAQSNLLEKQIAREHAELNLVEARQRLGLLTGDAADATEALSLPSDRLPVVTQENAAQAFSSRRFYVDTAFSNRGDLLSLEQKTKAAELLLLAARDATEPKLDLISGIGYDSYLSGSRLQRTLQALEYRQKNPDWSIGLRFSYPLENHGARGGEAIAVSQVNQHKIRRLELKRTVEISIATVLQALRTVAREVEKADQSVTGFLKVVDNEREKYLMGESTLFDLLFMQDKLDAAQLSKIDVLNRGARLMTRLQFESGRLLNCHDTECEFNADSEAVLFGVVKRTDR